MYREHSRLPQPSPIAVYRNYPIRHTGDGRAETFVVILSLNTSVIIAYLHSIMRMRSSLRPLLRLA